MRSTESFSEPFDFSEQRFTVTPETMAIRRGVYQKVFGADVVVASECVLDLERGLRTWWRARIAALGGDGWNPFALPRERCFAGNCPSFRAMPVLSKLRCSRTWLCPYCWARRVAELVVLFKATLVASPERQLLGFIGRPHPDQPKLETPKQLIAAEREMRHCETWMAPPGFSPVGGLSFLCPDTDINDRIVIQRRGLIVVRAIPGVAPLVPGRLASWRDSVDGAFCYDRGEVAKAVSQAACFPWGLCVPPAALVVPFLKATRNVKFLATYGTIRNGEDPGEGPGLSSARPGGSSTVATPEGPPSQSRPGLITVEEHVRRGGGRDDVEFERREDDEYYGWRE
jgi:hypothetical protein